MDNLEINLDETFKNIDIVSGNNNNSSGNIGMDLLLTGNSSPSNNHIGSPSNNLISSSTNNNNMSGDNGSIKSIDLGSPINMNNNGTNNGTNGNNNIDNGMNTFTDPLMNNDPLINNTEEANGGYRPVHILSQTDIKNEKIDLLYKFKKLNDQGVRTTSNYNMNSNLDDMRNEYIKLKKQRDVENSIKFQRKVMMAAVSGAEFLNSKFDPFDIKLDGWSESVNEGINDFDEVFEQLYDKYGGGGEMAPELKLVLMLGGSAFMFHLSNTMFKSSIPNMGDIMQQNPDLMKQFAKAAVGSMSGQPSMQQQHQQQQQPSMPNFMQQPQQPSRQPSRQEMDGPVGDLDDIINNMNLQPNTAPDLDNISIISGDSNNSKGITLNL